MMGPEAERVRVAAVARISSLSSRKVQGTDGRRRSTWQGDRWEMVEHALKERPND